MGAKSSVGYLYPLGKSVQHSSFDSNTNRRHNASTRSRAAETNAFGLQVLFVKGRSSDRRVTMTIPTTRVFAFAFEFIVCYLDNVLSESLDETTV